MSWKGHDAYPVPLDTALDTWTTTTQTWLLEPWIAYGSITMLVGQAKRAGKTTFLMDMFAAQHHRVPFLGQLITPGPVLYVTEQSPTTFKIQARGSSMYGHGFPIDLMARYRLLKLSWDDLCEVMLERCQEFGHRTVAMDTWSGIASFRADGENDSAEARKRLDGLGPILATGAAIIIVAHQGHMRKGAEITPITAARGSTGLGDGVDQALLLTREYSQAPNERTLWAAGRFLESPAQAVPIRRNLVLGGSKAHTRIAIANSLPWGPGLEQSGRLPKGSLPPVLANWVYI